MRFVIIGEGRIGGLLARLPESMIIRRGERIPEADVPIVVCTRNDDLEIIINGTPPKSRRHLIFVQNGMIQPLLRVHGLERNTQALLYFAVSELGAEPVDGGGTVVCGPHDQEFAQLLIEFGLACQTVDRGSFNKQMVEKLLWNCVFGLLCQVYKHNVGTIASQYRAQVQQLVAELQPIAEREVGTRLDEGVVDRLCAYSHSIADYCGAVKEWTWRNGWFLQAQRTPLHSRLLDMVRVD